MRGIAVLLLSIISPAMAGEEVIGRWCSHAPGTVFSFDSVITIEKTGAATARMVHEFPKSIFERSLSQLDETTFIDENGLDGYRVLPSGVLEALDDMGVIEVAYPWNLDLPASDCWR